MLVCEKISKFLGLTWENQHTYENNIIRREFGIKTKSDHKFFTENIILPEVEYNETALRKPDMKKVKSSISHTTDYEANNCNFGIETEARIIHHLKDWLQH